MKPFQMAVGSNITTSAFEVTNPSSVWINMIGDYSSQTVKMQISPDRSTYTDYYADGDLVVFSATAEGRKFDLAAGFYRFVSSSGGTPDIDIYVDGPLVRAI